MSRFIRSKYQQYKRDNEQLSTWLGRTAVNYGFQLANFLEADKYLDGGDGDAKPTANQLKNAKKKAKAKARAKAKAGGEQKQAQDGKSEDQEGNDAASELGVKMEKMNINDPPAPTSASTPIKGYLIPTHLYQPIAEHLVACSVRIPVETMQLLDRCIKLRFSCLKRFLSIPSASNEGHAHFINVLTDVYNIFAEYKNQESTEETKAYKSRSPSNRFAELAVEEDEDVEDLADIFLPEPPRPPTVSPARIRCMPEPSREELLLRALAFFEDVHHIRDEIIGVWERYKSGKISLITAAVTTNAALELLRKSHEDVVKSILPKFENSLPSLLVILFNVLYSAITGTSGIRIPPLWDEVNESDIIATTIYEHLLIPISQEIHGVADLFEHGSIPVSKPGYFGQYDPSVDVRQASFSRRCHQSQILICETYLEYLPLIAFGDVISKHMLTPAADVQIDGRPINIYFFDEMAVEIDTFRQTETPSLLLLIFGQIFVDINLVLGTSAAKALHHLRDEADHMLTTLERRTETEPAAHPITWPPENEEVIGSFKYELSFWRSVSTASRVPGGRSARKATIFERNPMLCGLVLFRLRIQYQDIGFKLVNSFATLLSTAHLVAACRLFGLMPGASMPSWPDMDLVLDIHGKEDIFGGKYPDTIDDSLVSWHYMMGYSTETLGALRHVGTDSPIPSYLRNRTRDAKLKSKSGAKRLRDHSQILPIFANKYRSNSIAGTTYDINILEKLFQDIQADRLDAGRKGYRSSRNIKIRRERKHRSPKYSILQMISLLEAGLEAETASIRFDYVSMHLRCFSILDKVRLSAHEYITSKVGPDYLDNDSQLPYVVGQILQFAAFSPRAAAQNRIKREGRDAVVIRSQRLMEATQVLGNYLRETGEGDAEIKRMRNV
ncbi:hypothetical protein V865_002084 [Kwoniella europaea PYCC6329]|uniref:DUF6604 domain-containing protein n=1 Tax=Kwoniella europaea PYCC6329 TaxID=1423913 RepID=A0AAX4KC75_9TREE